MVTLPRDELADELKAAEKAGSALGAQAMEAELRPQVERWKEACKWIAAGALGVGSVGALAAFLYGFTLGAGK
jgi:post-segregation antitoxin (ccd killing protein)